MNDPFEKKVQAGAIALAVMSTHPQWLLSLWGPGIDWPFVQGVWFWAVGAFKFCVWLMTL